jgi:hypothetical protein
VVVHVSAQSERQRAFRRSPAEYPAIRTSYPQRPGERLRQGVAVHGPEVRGRSEGAGVPKACARMAS